MSDFTSEFWSLYIIIPTIAALIFCAWMLLFLGKKDDSAASSSTTHTWDGNLTELNNPLPNWWRWMFWLLLIFSAGYLIWYPGLGSFQGIGKWSQTKQFDEEMAALEKNTKPMYDSYLKVENIADLAKNQQAMKTAERIFLNNCARCHGSDAGGAPGFKSLKNGAWNWGGTPAEIEHSITGGQHGVMMAMGEQLGGEPGVKAVVAYMRSLSRLDHDTSLAGRGETLFEEHCTMCHGTDGKGNGAGAPDLTDSFWDYGGSEKTMIKVVESGINTESSVKPMPPHEGILSKGQIRILTAYVWGLTNK